MLVSGQHKKKPPPLGAKTENYLGSASVSKNPQIFSDFRLTKRPEAGIIAHVDRLDAARQN